MNLLLKLIKDTPWVAEIKEGAGLTPLFFKDIKVLI